MDEIEHILYQVETKYLNRTVKRNMKRFSNDFMFQLSKSELLDLKCQIGTSSWGGRRKLPTAFTEHDEAISQIIRALNNLIEQPPKTKKIGFAAGERISKYST